MTVNLALCGIWPEPASGSSILVKMAVYLTGDPFRNALDRHQVIHGGAADGLGGAEMVQQRALAPGADAGDLVERVPHHLLFAAGAVRADGETVRLVAQALDEIKHRVAHRQHEGLA